MGGSTQNHEYFKVKDRLAIYQGTILIHKLPLKHWKITTLYVRENNTLMSEKKLSQGQKQKRKTQHPQKIKHQSCSAEDFTAHHDPK